MKKLVMIFIILFSIMIYSVAQSAPAITFSKGQVIGKSTNKSWKVKIGKLIKGKEGANSRDISFSEDGGKTYFLVANCSETTVVWSPDGKYFLFNCLAGPRFLMPHMQDGYWFFDPQLYDPAKRIIFAPNVGEALYTGANWIKDSKTGEISIKYFDGNDDEIRTSRTTIAEWEKASTDSAIQPYLEWLGQETVAWLKKKQIGSFRTLVKGAPPAEIKSAMATLSKFNPSKYRAYKIRVFKSSNSGSVTNPTWIVTAESIAGKCSIVVQYSIQIGFDHLPQINKFEAIENCEGEGECTR
jgi:hypothetical protein